MAEESNQWEYRIVTAGTFFTGPKEPALEAYLNELGQEGWELVGTYVLANSSKATLILKRPLDRTARRWRSMP